MTALPPMLVTLQAAKIHLRQSGDADDQIIALMIQAASEAVLDLADGWSPTAGGEIPSRILLAVLALVANAYDDRDGFDFPASARRLLLPLRKLDV